MINNELSFTDENVKFIELVHERLISRTQSIRVIIIEKEGTKYVSFHKWWRKDPKEPWKEGKGFDLTPSEAENMGASLKKAFELL